MGYGKTWQLWIAGGLMASAGSLYAWSAMIPAIRESYSATTEQAGMVFSSAILAFTIAVILVPRAGRRLQGLRGGGIIGAAGSVFLGLSAVSPNYSVFVVSFGLGFGAASGGIYIVVLDIAGRAQRPILFVPVMVAAFGLGSALFGPLLRLLVGAGGGLASLSAVAAPLVCASALALALEKRAVAEIQRTEAEPRGMKIADRHRVLLLWLIFCLGSMAGLMTLGLASSIVEVRGASVLLSSATLAGIAVGNTAGRLAVGFLAQWMLPQNILAGATPIIALGIAVAWHSSIPAIVGAGLVLIASGYGLVASGIPALTREMFGSARFGRVFSLIFSAWGVAGLTAPWLAGWIFDQWGDYRFAFFLALGATVLASVLSLALVRIQRRRRMS